MHRKARNMEAWNNSDAFKVSPSSVIQNFHCATKKVFHIGI